MLPSDPLVASVRPTGLNAMVSTVRLFVSFEPPEIKAHTPAPRTPQRQASRASLRRSKQDGLASEN
jgi:hypothetical protein